MKKLVSMILIVLLVAIFAQGFAVASDFQLYATCKISESADQAYRVFQVGMSTDSDMEFEFFYLGNGPQINATSPFYAGSMDDAFDVLILDDTQSVTLIVRAFYPDGTDISHQIVLDWNTKAAACKDNNSAFGADGKLDVDDHGKPNNPATNDRANACYSPGHAVCVTDEDWRRGWYEIRGMR